MPIYAAYGTNMHPVQMTTRAPHSPYAGTGWLRGWRLTFAGSDPSWEGAIATVVPDPESAVFVVLYDVSDEDALEMDRWEGTDLIPANKIRVRVEPRPTVPFGPPLDAQSTEFDTPLSEGPGAPAAADAGLDELDEDASAGSSTVAWCYVMDAFEGGLPSARYLGLLAEAAEAASAPESYVHQLRTRDSRNVGPGA